MTKKETNAFFRYLKEVGAYSAYIKNLKEDCCGHFTIDTRLHTMNADEPINVSFAWADTPEGHKFWYHLNNFYIKNHISILASNTSLYMETFKKY